jgi:DHA2 family multidrug resistance protein
MAVGQSMAFTSVVANWVMQAFNTGALRKPQWVLTFSAFIHTIRIFGGECGASLMTHFLSAREKVHSNLIGLHADFGNWRVTERLSTLAAGMAPTSNGMDGASARAVGLMALQVRRQAFTEAIVDGFILCGWAVVLCLLIVALLERAPIAYSDLDTVPGKPVSA